MSPVRPVLYAEDDENDAFLMERAFRKTGIVNPLRVVHDGYAAMRYLAGQGEYANRVQNPLPALALLDLNLPRASGLELVKWIREQPQTQQLPIVILTSSNQDRDLRTAYAWGANAYLVKPPCAAKLLELVGSLRDICLEREEADWLQLKGNVPPPPAAAEPAV